MPAYQSYEDERRMYPDAHAIHYADDEHRLIVKKLCRHYGVRYESVNLTFRNQRNGWGGAYHISLPHDTNIALTLHEFVHCALHVGCRGMGYKIERGHGLVFEGWVRRVHKYAQARNYWQEEIQRRRDKAVCARQPKPQPTAREKRLGKIASQEAAIKRMESKVKRLKTLIAKRKRSISQLKRHV